MAYNYATTKQFAERSGLGVRIVDELVGTSKSSGTFGLDLSNDNIISNTYTLNYASSPTTNIFTALTENNHYTLDKESGRVTITGTGSALLGDSVTTSGTTIYATYTYVEGYNDTVVMELLDNASNQIEKLTGRYYGSGTFASEYRDGKKHSDYPTTDNPYMADWDKPDAIVLKKYPLKKIDQIFFLTEPMSIGKFFNYDAGTTTYTDKTTAVNSSTETPFNLFDSSPATGDIIYIGSSEPFLGLDVNLSTEGVGASTIDWEYYNGTAWADISETETDSGSSTFTASGKFTWTYPWGWSKTTVNSSSMYWVRGTLTDNYTTDPICATMTIQDNLSEILEPRYYNFKSNGIVNLTGANIPNGVNNVRIDYWYGLTAVPTYITELTILLATEQAFMGITGGSYNEATGYQLGSKSVQIGEAWVNVKQVLEEVKKKIDSIYKMIGSKGDISVI